jgi:glycosyltransferase involved in cell wall biosynthesis
MDYFPNVDGCVWFADEILPLVRERHPEARFTIVGNHPSAEILRLGEREGIEVTGFVPETRDYLARAAVAIAPLRSARGIQNKVLEAMAMARPVVASACAAEGIEATNGKHFLIAKSVNDEARLVCDLLADPEQAGRLGEQARILIHSHYSWERQLADLPRLCGLYVAVADPVPA